MIYFVQETKHNRVKIGHTTQLETLDWLSDVTAVHAWFGFGLRVAERLVNTQPELAQAYLEAHHLTQLTRLTPQGIVELAALIEQGGLGLHLPDQQIPWRVALGLLPNEDEEDDPRVD